MMVQRERFLAEREENVLRPYEACCVGEEGLIGEFGCSVEATTYTPIGGRCADCLTEAVSG